MQNLPLENLDTQEPGAKFAQGTFWNAFNTVTYLNDHVQGRTTDGRLTSSWYGRNRRVKLKALDTALEMAGFSLKKFLCGVDIEM